MTTCGIAMHASATIVFVLSVGLLLYFLIRLSPAAGRVSLASPAADR